MHENIQLKGVVKEIKEDNRALKYRINSLEQDFKQNNRLLKGVMPQKKLLRSN